MWRERTSKEVEDTGGCVPLIGKVTKVTSDVSPGPLKSKGKMHVYR